MSSGDSMHKKDHWLHDERYIQKLQPYLSLYVELKKVHYDYVLAFIHTKNIKPEDADVMAFNILVEYTIALANKGDKGLSTSETKGYILGIARNFVFDYLNSEKREKKNIEPTDDPKMARSQDNWEDDMIISEEGELKERKRRVLAECQEEFFQKGKDTLIANVNMILDRFFFKKSNKELAEDMNTTEGGIKRRYSQSRALWERCVKYKMQFKTYKPFLEL